ncbi:transposase (plasmid) [Bradyrhizobium sp. PMVTL-01]
MGYLGLVPTGSSTGDRVKRGSISKAGNGRARRRRRPGVIDIRRA